MSEKTVRHVIRFPSDLYDKLRKIAEKEERSINWEVIAAVRLLVEQHERQTESLPLDQKTKNEK